MIWFKNKRTNGNKKLVKNKTKLYLFAFFIRLKIKTIFNNWKQFAMQHMHKHWKTVHLKQTTTALVLLLLLLF